MESHRSVVANMVDCNIAISEFELKSPFYISFRSDTLGKSMDLFANGLGDLGSIPGRVIPKIPKMVLDASLFNTQQYKVRIKGKVEQSRERSSALPYTLV